VAGLSEVHEIVSMGGDEGGCGGFVLGGRTAGPKTRDAIGSGDLCLMRKIRVCLRLDRQLRAMFPYLKQDRQQIIDLQPDRDADGPGSGSRMSRILGSPMVPVGWAVSDGIA
jgi:hypothetical protein